MQDKTNLSLSFSHIGICVSDLETSIRFYAGALDFKVAEFYEVGNEVSQTMELNDIQLHSQFMRRDDGVSLELLGFTSPDTQGSQERRPMNQYGFTHLSFYVDDIDLATKRIENHGGTVHRHTYSCNDVIKLIFCTDPDGTRVELMQRQV